MNALEVLTELETQMLERGASSLELQLFSAIVSDFVRRFGPDVTLCCVRAVAGAVNAISPDQLEELGRRLREELSGAKDS